MEVRVRNIGKKYGKTQALKGVSFSFAAKQIYGFVGPNGAGKTTTLRILATLEEPCSGDACINGISVTQYPEKIRELVGFMPDALPAHSDISVHEYLDFFARVFRLKGENRRKRIQVVEEFTGLTGIQDRMLKALSKGMKQRVSLARALVHDPPVLLMDEPASGLDPRARVELRELLKILARQGKAILISSHILSELTEICTGAIIIEHGRILRTGAISELTDSDRPSITVLIRTCEEDENLFRSLLETPCVSKVNRAGRELSVEMEGGDKESSELLASLIKQGHRICEFKPRHTDLEDIFMRITKGDV
ncbi:MAG: ABC transporter ATP-binding protein [Desulfococcaceae bacterium]